MIESLTAEAIHLSRGFFKHPFVRAIEKEFGFKGSKLVLDILIETTETGFETPYCKEFRDKVAGRNNVSERLVDMVVHRMVKNGFLDQAKYADRHVLAIPAGNILEDEKNIGSDLPYFFVNAQLRLVSSEETIVIPEITQVISEKTPVDKNYSGKNPQI